MVETQSSCVPTDGEWSVCGQFNKYRIVKEPFCIVIKP